MIVLIAALMLVPLVASAQAPAGTVTEIRPFVGAFLPSGQNRGLLKEAVLGGAQVALQLNENVHLLGSVAWSPTREKPRNVNNRLDLYQYDVGAELMAPRPLPNGGQFSPFVGIGAGGRTYHLRDADVSAQTHFTGYGALGGEFKSDRFGLRIEARDYVSRFTGLTGNESASARNDFAVLAGLAIHLW
jgi:hypothetical protein